MQGTGLDGLYCMIFILFYFYSMNLNKSDILIVDLILVQPVCTCRFRRAAVIMWKKESCKIYWNPDAYLYQVCKNTSMVTELINAVLCSCDLAASSLKMSDLNVQIYYVCM